MATPSPSQAPVLSSNSLPSAATLSPYPFAAAPDIIRAYQKDAYFTGHLSNTLADVLRRLLGARTAHALAPELRSLAGLLYLALTTLPGNRTLGEEYCDLVQVDASDRGRLPALRARAAYIAAAVVLPYFAGRLVPRLRARIRALLERRLSALRQKGRADGREARVWAYLSRHLSAITSPAPFQALTLALFYFGGTYYELSKRLLSLRYVFTRTVPDTPDRAGYELLGVLLLVQLGVQSYMHVRATLAAAPSTDLLRERPQVLSAATNVSLDHDNSYTANNELLLGGLGGQGPPASKVDIAVATNTPLAAQPRFSLSNEKVMAYIKGSQQRKCTLCLEELKDPAATQCGHVFCWECIGDWVKEKPECPLCRREAMVQHILPLRII
jgi:peroxin-10